MTSSLNKYLKLWRSLKQDRRGAVAMLTGIMAISLSLAVGLAIDAARLNNARQTLQDAADSAALAGAVAYSGTTTVQATLAKNTATADFKAYKFPDWIVDPEIPAGPQVNIPASTKGLTVTVTATATVEATVMKIFKPNGIAVQVTATAINPFITVTFTNITSPIIQPDDWDELYIYAIPPTADGVRSSSRMIGTSYTSTPFLRLRMEAPGTTCTFQTWPRITASIIQQP